MNNKTLSTIYQTTKVLSLLNRTKGSGIVILDRKHYIEKCLSIFESKQFKKLKKDPTKTLESKVQRA